ncbi:MAG: hypothetical protein Q4E53_05090 [Eubacteriales bacterium]|nr:hypothetical protein [Eubacteriales bacterium]
MMRGWKKTLAFLLAFVLVFGSLTGFKSNTKTSTIPVTVEGTIFGGAGQPIKTELTYGPDLLIHSNNKKYDKTIAGLSALLCADSYFRDKDLANGKQNRVLVDGEDASQYTHTTLLKKLGFTEVEYIETYKEKKYSYDTNDSSTFLLAHENVDNKYDIFVCVARGCFSSSDWLSCFDLGADTSAYETLTGKHPEWTEKNQQKGLSIAAERTNEFLENFMKKYGNPARKSIVLLTGHSKGGVIANILGAKMEENKKVKSFTYAFNTPKFDNKPGKKAYKTIYNVVDDGDLFSDHFPFQKERFYGLFFGPMSIDLSIFLRRVVIHILC